MPVHLSTPAFDALLWLPLSRPPRGPQGNLGSERGGHRSLWGFSTGRPWQGWPGPTEAQGPPALQAPPVSHGLEAAHPRQGLGQAAQRGRPRCFNAASQALRRRVERPLGWAEQGKRRRLRFARIQPRPEGMQGLAYTWLNLRQFCGT